MNEFDVKRKQSHIILQEILRMFAFDLSPDDTKILYIEGGKSRGENRYLGYRDLASGQKNTVPNVGFGPGTLRRTAGGSNFTLVDRSERNTAHGGWLGRGINVASLDGKTNAALIPESIDNPSTLVMSPDGESKIVRLQPQSVNGVLVNGTLTSVGHGDLFKVDYPKVIPEFGSVTTFLMAARMVGAIVLASHLQTTTRAKANQVITFVMTVAV